MIGGRVLSAPPIDIAIDGQRVYVLHQQIHLPLVDG